MEPDGGPPQQQQQQSAEDGSVKGNSNAEPAATVLAPTAPSGEASACSAFLGAEASAPGQTQILDSTQGPVADSVAYPAPQALLQQLQLVQQHQQQQQQQLQQLEAPAPTRRPVEPGFWERVMNDLLSYQEQDTEAPEAAHAAAAAGMTPAAKRASTAPVEGPLTPDRGALLEGDKRALDQLMGLMKGRQMQLGDGFWQKAWHQLQRYLNSAELGEQPGAAAGAGAVGAGSRAERLSLGQLPHAEQIALRGILDSIRKDHIATLQRRLQELGAGLDGTAGLQGAGGTTGGLDGAAAAAAGAAGDGMMMQGVNGGALESMMNNFLYGGGGDGDEGAYQVQGLTGIGADKSLLRSDKYTGVYKSGRSEESWRAQICFGDKVIKLGPFATEDEATHALYDAALLFRGATPVVSTPAQQQQRRPELQPRSQSGSQRRVTTAWPQQRQTGVTFEHVSGMQNTPAQQMQRIIKPELQKRPVQRRLLGLLKPVPDQRQDQMPVPVQLQERMPQPAEQQQAQEPPQDDVEPQLGQMQPAGEPAAEPEPEPEEDPAQQQRHLQQLQWDAAIADADDVDIADLPLGALESQPLLFWVADPGDAVAEADYMDIDDLPEGLLEDQGPHFAE